MPPIVFLIFEIYTVQSHLTESRLTEFRVNRITENTFLLPYFILLDVYKRQEVSKFTI